MQNKLTPKKLDSYKYTIGGNDFNRLVTTSTYEVLSKYFYGKTCLELGSADGYGTALLLKRFEKVVAVDGSKLMLSKLKKIVKSQKLQIVHSMFEDLALDEEFDTIIIAHVIDIVDDPISFLQSIKKYAHKATKILIEVPNAHSLHRQAGVIMGLLKTENDFNRADKAIGHQRIYNIELLLQHVKNAGLKIKKSGGFLLKPFSNAQMYKLTKNNSKLAKACITLGAEYPDIAAEIFVVCTI